MRNHPRYLRLSAPFAVVAAIASTSCENVEENSVDDLLGPIDAENFASATASGDGNLLYIAFTRPVIEIESALKGENPLFISCGNGGQNPVFGAAPTTRLRSGGRVLEIKVCEDECLSRSGNDRLCGNTDHFRVIVPPGNFETADNATPVPQLDLRIDSPEPGEVPTISSSGPTRLERCEAGVVEFEVGSWGEGVTHFARLTTDSKDEGPLVAILDSPEPNAVTHDLTVTPTVVDDELNIFLTSFNEFGDVARGQHTIVVEPGPAPEIALFASGTAGRAPGESLRVYLRQTAGPVCGSGTDVDSAWETTSGGVAVDAVVSADGRVLEVAGDVVDQLIADGNTEITVRATFTEYGGGGRTATATFTHNFARAEQADGLSLTAGQRSFVYGKDAPRVRVRRVVEAVPHFIDDWQGETAYVRVSGTNGSGGSWSWTGARTLLSGTGGIEEYVFPPYSELLGDALEPGEITFVAEALLGEEVLATSEAIVVTLAESVISGAIEVETTRIDDAILVEATLADASDEFGVSSTTELRDASEDVYMDRWSALR